MENDEIAILKEKDRLLLEIETGLYDVLESRNRNFHSLLQSIEQFQPSPRLLDSKLNRWITRLCELYDLKQQNAELNKDIALIFYHFTKVRGYKAISNCLSSNVYLVEPIVEILDHKNTTNDWKQNYFLILWLSILILNPFQLTNIDQDLPAKIYEISLDYAKNNSKELDVALVLMSRFLSRADSSDWLDQFYNILNSDNDYVILNRLETLNYLLKIGKFANLQKYLNVHYLYVKSQLDSTNLKIVKSCIKNCGKLGELFLLADQWDDLEDIINYLIHNLDYNNTTIRYCVARQLAKICSKLETEYRQEVLAMLLQDLEIENFDESQFKILSIDYDLVNINKYHGVLLTVAEFMNARIVPLEFIPGIISILHKTLFLEQNRLTHSVGSNIRDLSCYICWCLLKKHKSLAPALLKTLFQDLLLSCLFDKDIMIRRSASAVLQELIGRFGGFIYKQYDNWSVEEHVFKLKLIEFLDFAILGDVKKLFNLSVKITDELNNEFTHFLTKRLYELVFSNDYDIWKLSIQYLVRLIKLEAVDQLVEELLITPRPGIWFLIAELIQLKPSHMEEITQKLQEQTFDHHKDSALKGEELLFLISVLMKSDDSVFTVNKELVFNIIKVSNSPQILDKFLLVMANVHYLNDEFFAKLMYFMKMGNNVAIANSFKAVNKLSTLQLDELITVIEDTRQDSEVRCALINSLAVYYNQEPFDDVIRVLNQLDDYTITSQGDVGSKLRLSTIKFVDYNLTSLQKVSGTLIKFVNTKLIRLCFDSIDKLRFESFNLFIRASSVESVSLNELSYFQDMLNFLQQNLLHSDDFYHQCLLMEFFKGYSLVAGGVISSNKLIQDSFQALVELLSKLDDEDSLKILNIVSTILSKSTEFSLNDEQIKQFGVGFDIPSYRDKCKDKLFRLQNSALILFERLFEINYKFPTEYDFKSLFVKVFNLQLNQLNQVRLRSCFKIFKYLYLRENSADPFFEKGKSRMVHLMCTSKNDRIRVICSEILFELYLEAGEKANQKFLLKLDEVDWGAKGSLGEYIKFFE